MKTETESHTGKLPYLFILGIIFLISACGGGKMNQQEQQEFQELVQNVTSDSRDFEIVNQWANPQTGNSINLIGNTNFIRFEGDSVEVFLPYFGERYSGGGYGSAGGISYEGPLKDLTVEERRNQGKVIMSFEGDQENEELQFLITLYPSGKTNTSVTTTERSSITYRGELQD